MVRALQRTRGQHAVGGGHGVGHFINAKTARRQFVRVQLHAHGVLLLPVNHHLGHAVHHGKPLANECVCVFVEHIQRQGCRRNAQIQNGQIGGVNLAKAGRHGHVGGQTALGKTNGRLHVQSSCVNIAVERKLYGYARAPRGTDRRDGINARNGKEFFFQRRGDGRSHGFRVGPGQLGLYLNGGKIHRGKLVDRQIEVARDAKKQHAQHDQHGGHRSADKKRGYVHAAPSEGAR